jgi:hypothetical protein
MVIEYIMDWGVIRKIEILEKENGSPAIGRQAVELDFLVKGEWD